MLDQGLTVRSPNTDILLGSILDTDTCASREADRRIGVELEFGTLSVQESAEVIVETFGGKVCDVGSNVIEVVGTELGDVRVEIDADLLRGDATGSDLDKTTLQHKTLSIAGDLSSGVVPVEIVLPPITLCELEVLDDLVEKLRQAGASGTRASLFAGFGLHLNPEERDLSADRLTRMLKAFILLEDVLWEACEVDPTRSILPFISKFPDVYTLKVVSPSYAPTMSVLIDDYLFANATRNRDLDMLPMFAHIDEDRVRDRVSDPLVKARPTYHYRLPNCDLDQKGWSVSREWKRWACVEALANDAVTLDVLSTAYMEAARDGLLADWRDIIAEVIQ